MTVFLSAAPEGATNACHLLLLVEMSCGYAGVGFGGGPRKSWAYTRHLVPQTGRSETEPLHRPTVKVRKAVRGCHGTSHTFGGGEDKQRNGVT